MKKTPNLVIKLFGGGGKRRWQKCLKFFFESVMNMRQLTMEISEAQLFPISESVVGEMGS